MAEGERPLVSAKELETLRAEIDQLKQKQPSLPNWLVALGAVCGLCAALASVASGLWNAHAYLSSSPKLSVVEGPTLNLTYMPQQSRVMFSFTFSVANDGDQPNVVSDLSAKVTDRFDSSRQVGAFTSTDFECSTGNAKLSVPFTVGQGLPTSIACTASAYVPETGRAILADGNSKQFIFSMIGQKKTTGVLSYCFDLPDDATNQLRGRVRRVSVRFISPTCE